MRLSRLAPKTITQRMVLYIGAFTCTVLAATAWLDYTTSRRALEAQADGEARKQAQAAAQDLDDAAQAAIPASREHEGSRGAGSVPAGVRGEGCHAPPERS